MNEKAIFSADVGGVLSYRFEEVRAFDVAYRSADFRDNDVRFRNFGVLLYKAFGFVGYVGNNLNGLPEIFAFSFFFENSRKNFTGSEVGVFVKILVNKSLVMSEVEVGFRAVFGYVNFSVLNGVHRTRVYVHVGVEFLCRDFIASQL